MRCSFFLCLTPNQLFGFSRKYVGIDDALLPNREWNQKQKHKKNSLGATWNALHLAEGLCGWRHGNSFPMTQSAQSLRQMRSIPHCPKAVFFMFLFLIPFTIRQQCIIYAQIFSTEPE